MRIVIASGKGGTGKTFLATNLGYALRKELGKKITYLDCDVEEPNGHLFLPINNKKEREIFLSSPIDIDTERCDGCGKCSEVCMYNAIAVINKKALLFPELCHVCGACSLVCAQDAILEGERLIGRLFRGDSMGMKIHYGLLEKGEGGMTPTLIKEVKKQESSNDINILDAPPGTSCSAVESVMGSDLCVLVTDLTPFGLHDLELSVNMCRVIGIEPVVIINRSKFKDPGVRKYCEKENIEVVGEIPDDRQIAELYSKGYLVAKENSYYREVFSDLSSKLLETAYKKRPVKKVSDDHLRSSLKPKDKEEVEKSPAKLSGEEIRSNRQGEKGEKNISELVVISGKGGTGKTSIVASLAALERETVVADCDVDASDLHLVLQSEIIDEGLFSGGYLAEIDQEKCVGCGSCYEYCGFDSIVKSQKDQEGQKEIKDTYYIDELSCEGCGVCKLVCHYDAVQLEEAINGKWYKSKITYGYMAHAKLGIAEENSGRLVTLTRQNATDLLRGDIEEEKKYIDGSPGTGCPVIASITGVDYALVVTEPTVSGLHDLERILELCNFFEIDTGVIVNKSDINPEKTRKIEERVNELGLDYLGALTYDEDVIKAQIEGKSIVEYAPESEVSRGIKDIFIKLREKILA